MNASQQATLKSLNSKHLPVLPPGAPYLLKTLTDESIDFHHLARSIERFPTIAARLIALVNSAWSAPVSPLTSLEAACARLGFAVVRSTSIALAVAAPFNPTRCPAFDAQRFWCRALLVADTSSWLAQSAGAGHAPETVRAAGLLHNLGLLLLADQLPDETHQVLQQHNEIADSHLERLLHDRLGFDHCDAGGLLGETWGLPAPLVTAMAHHLKAPESLSLEESSSIVGYAVTMAHAAEQQIPWQAPDSMQASLGISPIEANRLFAQVITQLEKTRELAEILFNT
ncbi:MAG: HDOD domain-containing protein [Gammaproteobacteria bacterium]|nr:HDOD domain-containing protein [Gammaproteobacteria bacterium]